MRKNNAYLTLLKELELYFNNNLIVIVVDYLIYVLMYLVLLLNYDMHNACFFSKKSECIMQLSHSVTKFMKKPRKMAVVKYVVVEVALRLEVGTYILFCKKLFM